MAKKCVRCVHLEEQLDALTQERANLNKALRLLTAAVEKMHKELSAARKEHPTRACAIAIAIKKNASGWSWNRIAEHFDIQPSAARQRYKRLEKEVVSEARRQLKYAQDEDVPIEMRRQFVSWAKSLLQSIGLGSQGAHSKGAP